MSHAVERLLAIELDLDQGSDTLHRITVERAKLQRERSSILLGITWEDRQEYERVMAERLRSALDHISAVRSRS